MYKRTETRPIKVGNVQIGGQNKVIIQSMTNTKTKDVDSTVKQILELEINVLSINEENSNELISLPFISNVTTKLLSSIHFNILLASSFILESSSSIIEIL